MFNTRKAAIAALFLTAVLWSSGGLAFRMMTLDNGLAISGYRSFFAAIFYVIAFRALPKMENTGWFKASIFAYMATTTLFVVANTLTTAANAIVLQYTAPIFTCIFIFFIYRTKIPMRDMIATAIIFVGIAVFFFDSLAMQVGTAATVGNTIAVASGVSFGLQAVVIGRTAKPHNVFTYGNMFNVLIALPFILQNPITSWLDLGIIIYLGVVQIGLAYLLFSFAVKKVAPLELILIPALEPLLNPIWVFLFDGQAPTLLAIGGGAIIIVTIVVWSVCKELPGDRV
ncbi:MAG: DMT family transporter [Defluviitaleaceae bacterium]|nr:DMT family transporter [Defluviitaleaceae bacterium]